MRAFIVSFYANDDPGVVVCEFTVTTQWEKDAIEKAYEMFHERFPGKDSDSYEVHSRDA